MLYLSQLLNAPIVDQHDRRVGKITDVLTLVSQVGQEKPAYPTVLLVEIEDDQRRRVPTDALERGDGVWRLLYTPERYAVQPELQREEEASLAHDVLDKQIIDLEQKKTVRVNEVSLSDNWQILGVDKSPLGLIRRLAPSWLQGALSQPSSSTLIPWRRIELLQSQRHDDITASGIQPAVTTPQHHTLSGHLSELHPADIATIIHQLTHEQGARVLERLDDGTAADTMEEIDTERQVQILEDLPEEKAAHILQRMGPDEVADLLSKLPEDQAKKMLRQMEPEASEEVQELLGYEENTAGGLMTTDYIALNQTRTVEEALTAIRHNIQDNDVRIAYVYCVQDEAQDEHHPLGVVSIWDLLSAQPAQTLQELMEVDLIKVEPTTDTRTVSEIMAKYNLLAVPVINQEGVLEGVITVDDALDTLLPRGRRRRPRGMY
jgi:magnesium transporter